MQGSASDIGGESSASTESDDVSNKLLSTKVSDVSAVRLASEVDIIISIIIDKAIAYKSALIYEAERREGWIKAFLIRNMIAVLPPCPSMIIAITNMIIILGNLLSTCLSSLGGMTNLAAYPWVVCDTYCSGLLSVNQLIKQSKPTRPKPIKTS